MTSLRLCCIFALIRLTIKTETSNSMTIFAPYLALADVISALKKLKENAGGLFFCLGMSKNRKKLFDIEKSLPLPCSFPSKRLSYSPHFGAFFMSVL